ncbi:MAG: FecR domain-containing protein [Candidatus Sphingomonas phytovorans]|nr:FecR domain-containing protein [Sphingomonas sp.]WEK01849.1 MAG: FecR domain-containing protein [Sphingomonas sp.]
MNRALDDMEDEAAALWVGRHLDGMIDATAFSAWLAGAPDRRARFDALWATCMDDAVTDALERQDKGRSDALPHKADRKIALGTSLAGAVAAALLLAWFTPGIRFALTPAQEFATRAGEMRTIALEDGSQAVLSGESKIRVKLGSDRREVTLARGEAFFIVQHDSTRPFSVTAGEARATVLGTRFDIGLEGKRTDLAVEQGSVRFGQRDALDSGVVLQAGFATALIDDRISRVRATDRGQIAAWREGWIEVEDMPLSRLVAQLQRWAAKPIRIADEALAAKRVTGRVRLTRPAEQLDNLASLHGFQVHDTNAEYVLSER